MDVFDTTFTTMRRIDCAIDPCASRGIAMAFGSSQMQKNRIDRKSTHFWIPASWRWQRGGLAFLGGYSTKIATVRYAIGFAPWTFAMRDVAPKSSSTR